MHRTSDSTPIRQPARQRRDVRGRALTLAAAAIVTLGALFAWTPQLPPWPRLPDVRFGEVFHVRPTAGSPREQEVRTRFQQGVVMLHMREFEYAVASFHRVLTIAPDMPEAHVNMGFALIGLEEWAGARTFFEAAIELNRNQINAYYGLAVALEALGDIPGALGAMQAYVHRAPEDDPFRTRAVAALWEWRTAARESQAMSEDGDAGGKGAESRGEPVPGAGGQSATGDSAGAATGEVR